MDNVTVDTRIRVYPNQKPWMTKEVQSLLRIRDTTFRFGDGTQYSAAKANQKRGKKKIEDHFTSNNIRQVWQGVQHITSYRPSNASLAEELNLFFARFEVKSPEAATSHPPALSSHILTVEEHERDLCQHDMTPPANPVQRFKDQAPRKSLANCKVISKF
ncbi:hypothetical protein AAFF_G00216780 [Aldrovandia affinis]|uniref:Uncharacterized protein n=1 Tax=Aldrovandia affinis TaxID=143900 RepID=A0AAD7RGG5_9TELE|nr:hypothetical protein AAFF_G00216780 [Aldrovandia affinis]